MLELKNIGKAYGSTQILKDIDLCIMDGEIYEADILNLADIIRDFLQQLRLRAAS